MVRGRPRQLRAARFKRATYLSCVRPLGSPLPPRLHLTLRRLKVSCVALVRGKCVAEAEAERKEDQRQMGKNDSRASTNHVSRVAPSSHAPVQAKSQVFAGSTPITGLLLASVFFVSP